MKIQYLETKSLLDFEKEIGLEVIVRERDHRKHNRPFLASLEGAYSSSIIPTAIQAEGITVDQAIKNLCLSLSGTTICLIENNKKINVPALYHKEESSFSTNA